VNLTLVGDAQSRDWTLQDVWILRDRTGTTTTFDQLGRVIRVADPSGRTQSFSYSSLDVEPSLVTDDGSGRALHLTWDNHHVVAVAKDPPAAGQAAPTWAYRYQGDRLVGACTPLGPASCTTYTYTDTSSYRSEVLDDAPVGYWPLGESSGAVAVNAAARVPGQLDGAYTGVALGAPGALASSADTAASFGSVPTSALTLASDLLDITWPVAVEFWFRTPPGGTGLLFSLQPGAAPDEPGTGGWPGIYVGTDGKLRLRLHSQCCPLPTMCCWTSALTTTPGTTSCSATATGGRRRAAPSTSTVNSSATCAAGLPLAATRFP
jgi:YD repeat-containing protein